MSTVVAMVISFLLCFGIALTMSAFGAPAAACIGVAIVVSVLIGIVAGSI